MSLDRKIAATLIAATVGSVAAPGAWADTDPPAPAAPSLQVGPVNLVPGGFMELATIFRNRNETTDVSSNWNASIPLPNSPADHTSEFRESARQTRLSLLAQGPRDGNNTVEAYFEMDFQGAAPTANSAQSNSYTPRIRNIYADYANQSAGFYMIAGQSWSLVTLESQGMRARSERIPLTVDGAYLPGFNWTRNPQVRLVKEFNRMVSVGLSLESPQANIFNGPNALPAGTVFSEPGGPPGFVSTVNYSTDVAPDVVAKIAVDPGFGHYEVFGLGRWFHDRVGATGSTRAGGGVGGGFVLPLVEGLLDLQGSVLGGDGVGRYGSTQLPDVTLRPDGTFSTIREYDALLGVNIRPLSTLTLYGYVGTERADARTFTAVANGAALGYGYGSPLYNNSGCLTLGSTLCAANTRSVDQATAGGWWKYYQGELGNLQFGLQGSYTRRKIFSAIGGAPAANLTVVMASFRYYPFLR